MSSAEQPATRSAGALTARLVTGLLFLFAASAPISITVSQTALGLIGLIWIASRGSQRDAPRLKWSLIWPALGFFALSLLSAVLSGDRVFALKETGSDLLPLVFMFAAVDLVSSHKIAITLTRVLIVSGTVAALSGLTQLWTEGLAFRITGPMGHYMTLAGLVLTLLLLALSQLIFNRQRGWTVWLGLMSVALFVALLMTQTRGAWLGLLAGLTVLAWLRDKRYLLALPLVALLIVFAAPDGAKQRLKAMLTLKDVTSIERVYMWRAGWEMIKAHPLTGVGPKMVRKEYPEYKLPDDPWLERREFTHLHNNLVQLAAGRGLPALGCWVWLWVALVRQARRAFSGTARGEPRTQALTAGGLASVAAFQVAGLFEYNYGDGEVITLVLFVMALVIGSSVTAGLPRSQGTG